MATVVLPPRTLDVRLGPRAEEQAAPWRCAAGCDAGSRSTTTGCPRPELFALAPVQQRALVPEWSSAYQRLEALVASEFELCVQAQKAGHKPLALWPVEAAIETIVAVLVVPHGLTDLWAVPPVLMGLSYGTSCVLVGGMCPERWLPLCGAIASVVHFGMDLGFFFAACLVLACITCHVRQRDQAAYIGLLVYMLAVHLPFHYLRVVPNTPWYGWLLLLTFTLGSVWAKPLALMQCSSMCRRVAVALIVAHTVANGLP